MASLKIRMPLAVLAGVVAVGGAGYWRHYIWQGLSDGGDGSPARVPAAARTQPAGTGTDAAVTFSEQYGKEQRPATGAGAADARQGAVEQEQKKAERMRGFVASGNTEEALELARQLMKSQDAAVRSEVADVLGRIGIQALPELSDLVSDQDVSVRRAAFQHWKGTVAGISDDAKKSRIVMAGMSILDDRKDLTELAALLSGLPKPLALRSVVSVIQAANPYASEVAREHYARMTGEAYSTAQAAEKRISEISSAKGEGRTHAAQ